MPRPHHCRSTLRAARQIVAAVAGARTGIASGSALAPALIAHSPPPPPPLAAAPPHSFRSSAFPAFEGAAVRGTARHGGLPAYAGALLSAAAAAVAAAVVAGEETLARSECEGVERGMNGRETRGAEMGERKGEEVREKERGAATAERGEEKGAGEGEGEKERGAERGGLAAEVRAGLVAAVGEEGVVEEWDERHSHAKPWNSYHQVAKLPAAVVYPRSTEQVAAVVRVCAQHGVPVVAYGGGTSLEGHTTTPMGGVTINMTRMASVLAVHAADMDAVVQPGITWGALNDHLRPLGLFFPLDPGPGATIGGMAATRCSGSLAVRYGTMRDNVIALKAVLASGEVVKTAARTRKSAAGYDLTRLLIGSEGTLGVITEVTVRLHRIPTLSAVAMCPFPSIRAAADAAIATVHSGVEASRVELLDDVMLRAFNQANGYSYPQQPTLMFELTAATPEHLAQQLAVVRGVAEAHGAGKMRFAEGEEEKRELWRARKEALWAAYSLRPGTEPLITDVCVPLSRLAECMDATKADVQRSALPCPMLAHAGDGNFHVCIFFDPTSAEETAEAKALSAAITLRALAMDGTCTGEHGVGVGKTQYLERELGQEAVGAMQAVKDALDPQGILNPGKVLPPRPHCLS
ncbi:hypothetical protein CLOM_g19283 [Closterium sp. NIES-68]|nr:hypothetical protein CLOM_g19283 [Closterium sp. NIES-68]GJP58902.1 hypothetical protein CLOP_g6676 [Closterium sp. NIES-67]